MAWQEGAEVRRVLLPNNDTTQTTDFLGKAVITRLGWGGPDAGRVYWLSFTIVFVFVGN